MFANKFGTHQNVECGLVCIIHPPENTPNPRTRITPIPLQSVEIKASVVHAVAQVEVTQVYVNKEDQPIEAIYYFPVDSNGSVTHFHAELEGKTIKGVVKPEEEAKAQYEKAIQEKRSAFLGEANKPDIFKVRVGYLKPGSQVKIVVGYVTEVKNEKGSNALRFFIPTTVSPRYVPPTETDEKSLDLKNMAFSTTTPAPLSINVNVAIQGAFKSIESPSHQIHVLHDSVPDKPTWNRAVINLVGKTTDMDRDFVLNITPQEVHVPRLYKETMEGSTVVMTHLIPSFNLDEQKVELIFVLDRSGSMQGQSIGLAKKALKLFLHSLPVDCYFNVIGFGSSFQFLFPESVKYDDGSLKKALGLAESLDADLGGTEILQPLKEMFNRKSIHGYLRQIFVITDGEVSNTEQVIGFISANAHICRVFALGIGDGASHDLVEGIASAGGGTAAFASYKENIDPKVLHQLKNAIQPSLTNVSITWDGLPSATADASVPVEVNKEKTLLGYGKPLTTDVVAESTSALPPQVPEKIPPIFDGSQLVVFGNFHSVHSLPSGISISAQSPDGPLTLKIKLDDGNEADLGSTGMLHSLAAIKTINDLQLKILRTTYDRRPYGGNSEENGIVKELKDQIVKISCKYGVVSKYTSFVAVDTNSHVSDDNWVMQTRHVPSQFTHGWHGGSGYPAMATFCSVSSAQGLQDQSQQMGSIMACARSGGRSRKMFAAKSTGSRRSAPASTLCSKSRSVRSADHSTGFRATVSNAGKAMGLGALQSCLAASGSVPLEALDYEEEEFEEYKPANKEEEVKLTEEDRLHLIIKSQSFDGSFPLNESFCSAIRLSLDKLKSHAHSNGWDEKSYATAVALCYFAEKFADFKDSWELVALKARKWLQKNATSSMDAMISSATQFIQTN